MTATEEQGAPEVLDEAECRVLLRRTGVGRLGFTDGALPAILPVSFAVHDDHIVVPVRRGSPVIHAVRGAVVVFQTDSWGIEGPAGWWTVTAVGPARVVSDPMEVDRHDELDLFARRPEAGHVYITVQLALLRGWRGGFPLG